MNYKSFDLLNDLYFVRTGGSPEELKAANILKAECEKLGVDSYLETFKVDGYNIKEAAVKFFYPDFEVECAGVGMSGNTPDDGITGDFVYITSLSDAEITDVEGKVCMVHSKLVNYKLYKKLVEKKAAALVLCCGNVYDDNENVDLDPYMYRNRHYDNGKIPAVCIRMKDADKILKANCKKAYVKVIQDELQNDSHNVIAYIEGSKFKNEVICFTAHYDSVSYSKGAYDNATGSTTIMQLLAYFKEHQPLRSVKFIWCGSEEMGLLGSKAFCNDHKNDLVHYKLCINVDMTGVTIGNDIACVSANNSLVNFIKYLSCEVGFPIMPKQGVYSSDSTPFADSGVPSVSFARIAPAGGAQIHSHKDVMDYLSEDNYYKTCDFIAKFADRLVNSAAFPVEKEIPQNIKDELDVYLGRKEK